MNKIKNILLIFVIFISNYGYSEIKINEGNISIAFSPNQGGEELIIKVIDTAKETIRLSGYSFTALNIVKALLRAHKNGIEVGVLVDHNHNVNSKYSRSALNTLSLSGIYTKTVDSYKINHNKFIIVDGIVVQTGSYNYTISANKSNSENVIVLWNNPKLAEEYLNHWQQGWEQGIDWKMNY